MFTSDRTQMQINAVTFVVNLFSNINCRRFFSHGYVKEVSAFKQDNRLRAQNAHKAKTDVRS